MTTRPLASLLLLGAAACAPGAPESPTFTEDVRPILMANCVRCHGATPSGGAPAGFRLDRYGLDPLRLRGAADMATFVGERVRLGDMPRFGPALSERQVDTLRAWVADGVANGGVVALGPPNDAPTIALEAPLPDVPVAGFFAPRLRLDDPDGDAAWANVTVHAAFGEPFVVATDLEVGRPQLALDLDAWPNGDARLTANLHDDGGNDVTVELGTITVAHGASRAPRLTWRRPRRTAIFHARETVRIVLDPALEAGSDFSLAIDDDGVPSARVVTITAVHGDEEIALPSPSGGEILWDLADVPAASNWRLVASVEDGDNGRELASPAFVIVRGETTETYDSIAADVLVPVCGHCHIAEDDALNKLVPAVDLRAEWIYAQLGTMYRKVVQLEEMPPRSAETLFPGATLDVATRARVRSWLEGGAPGAFRP